MKRERSYSVALAVGSVAVLGVLAGWSGSSSAFIGDDGYSYTQPAAELVMPFDVSSDENETFLVVSNTAGTSSGVQAVTTHWRFWSETCDELADFSVCLTLNDTIVVDPRDMQSVQIDNTRAGPTIDLSGHSGVVTVVAYTTNDACDTFQRPGASIRDNAIVGSFTVANTTANFAFGADALGLGMSGGRVVVPPPAGQSVSRYDIQIFNPNTLDVSEVFFTRLQQQTTGPVIPKAAPALRFATAFIDNLEVPTSLPDTIVGCVKVTSVQPGLIPDTVTINSAGLIRLTPVSGVGPNDYLWGAVGEAIGPFGVGATLKTDFAASSPSRAFLDADDALIH